MSLSYDDVRNLPLPDLSLNPLWSLGTDPNFINNLIQGFKQRGGYDQPTPPDLDTMLARLSDAWAWLEWHALVGHSSENPQGSNWSRVTSTGRALLEDPNALSKGSGRTTASRAGFILHCRLPDRTSPSATARRHGRRRPRRAGSAAGSDRQAMQLHPGRQRCAPGGTGRRRKALRFTGGTKHYMLPAAGVVALPMSDPRLKC
jgi:hypothetical protein